MLYIRHPHSLESAGLYGRFLGAWVCKVSHSYFTYNYLYIKLGKFRTNSSATTVAPCKER